MRCPDCGNNLTELPLGGQVVHRCFKCGGFWLDSGAANLVTTEQLNQWRRISSVNPMFGWGGKNVCPADGTKLNKYSGDLIPPNISVKRCDRCGKWWFPADTLFSYKPATDAKINYFRQWGLMTDVRALLLPAVALVLMSAGTFFGVRMALQNQQASIAASAGIYEFAATYSGYGQGWVVFKVDKPVTEIKYQMRGSFTWKSVAVERNGGLYVAKLTGLVDGGQYIINILGEEFGFGAK